MRSKNHFKSGAGRQEPPGIYPSIPGQKNDIKLINPSHQTIHPKGTEMIPITHAFVRLQRLLKTGLVVFALHMLVPQAYAQSGW